MGRRGGQTEEVQTTRGGGLWGVLAQPGDRRVCETAPAVRMVGQHQGDRYPTLGGGHQLGKQRAHVVTLPPKACEIQTREGFEPEVLTLQIDELAGAPRRECVCLRDAVDAGGRETVRERGNRAHHLDARGRSGHLGA